MVRDSLYTNLRSDVEAFVFDQNVADIFDDMIRRSVPGYATVVAVSGVIASHYAIPGSNLYDLGCALGATSLSIAQHLKAQDCRIIAVDSSSAMIETARRQFGLQQKACTHELEFQCADVRKLNICNASVVVLNYTLQFIPPRERRAVLASIYAGMCPGGVLILSEKVTASTPEEEKRLDELHLSFKRANGYSELEISRKRTALENVLVSETERTHLQRLKNCGFVNTIRWFESFNFSSWLAWKKNSS